jgi:hypothetical protein
MMKIKSICLIVVAIMSAAVTVARAQERDGQNTDRANERRMGPGGGYPSPYPPPWRRQGGGWRQEDDWSEIAAFMKENCPKRWEQYQKLPPDRQDQLKWIVSRRWRLMQWVKTTNKDLYELQVNRWRVEDEVYGLTQDLKKTTSTDEPTVRAKLRSKIGEMIDLRSKERQMRIKRWEEQIAQERDMIAKETRDRDEIINHRVRVAERDAGNLGDEESEATTQESDGSPAVPASPTTAPAPTRQ